ncbi:hypothetical protein NARC_40092 [Candidatus Nitrosocosmicus arcticus]|uniref:Response regulatory domain-containing protein n=1 Tax=Candidatus Nitrosocosmicus arcticus TaxID=2035267 RepID=A0A557SX01_9ARCH|nr:hypothetical protein NARC_40092 [Candidatus Nitrosocosmicus arcticus]
MHICGSLLRTEKYNVKSYSNPAIALHFMEIDSYFYARDMDIRMPNMSGIQLYYKLKAIDPYINVLLVTALEIVKEWIDALPGLKIVSRKPSSRSKTVSNLPRFVTKCLIIPPSNFMLSTLLIKSYIPDEYCKHGHTKMHLTLID